MSRSERDFSWLTVYMLVSKFRLYVMLCSILGNENFDADRIYYMFARAAGSPPLIYNDWQVSIRKKNIQEIYQYKFWQWHNYRLP